MKKKLVVAIMLMVVALVGIMASCTFKLSKDDIYDIASYKTASPDRNTNVYVYDGDELIFSNVGGVIESAEGFDFSNLITQDNAAGLEFKSDYFANEALAAGTTESIYTADITNTKAFLGVDATDAKIEVVVLSNERTLKSTKIEYTIAKKMSTYNVKIEVLVG